MSSCIERLIRKVRIRVKIDLLHLVEPRPRSSPSTPLLRSGIPLPENTNPNQRSTRSPAVAVAAPPYPVQIPLSTAHTLKAARSPSD